MKKLINVILLMLFTMQVSCQDYLPGFDLNNFENTPLEELSKAVEKQDVKKINEIVKQGDINLEYYDPLYGKTLLMDAVSNDLDKSVEELLKLDSDPNKLSVAGTKNIDNENPTTPLLIACTSYNKINECNTKVLKLLIQYGGNVNYELAVFPDGADGFKKTETPLLRAAAGGCLSVVKVLVEAGADINKDNYYKGYGAITESIIQTNMDIAKYLIIEKKAKIPEYCFIQMETKKLTVTDLINYKQKTSPLFEKGTKNYRIGEEIKEYLRSIGEK